MKPRQSPEELYKQQAQTVEAVKPVKRPVRISSVPLEPMQSITEDDKVESLGRGLIFTIWVNTLLFSGVLILVAILYEWPLNAVILGFAIMMDIIAIFMTRRFLRK